MFNYLAEGKHVATVESLVRVLKSASVEADELEIEKLVDWYNSVRPDGLEHSEYAAVKLASSR